MQQPGPGGFSEGQGGQQQPPGAPPNQPPPTWQSPPPPGPGPQPPTWQSGPGAPGGPGGPGGPSSSGMPAWTSSLTSTAPVAGPAGYTYADVPNRAIAYIVDAIILFIALFILVAISTAVLGVDTIVGRLQNTTSLLVSSLLWAAFSAAYFIYTWTAMRGTPGMKVLGMQVGNAADGATLTLNQAVLRYAVLFGPAVLANLLGAFIGLGFILQLLALLWFIALLVTTAQSPTKQGLHDQYAKTMVVKAARSLG